MVEWIVFAVFLLVVGFLIILCAKAHMKMMGYPMTWKEVFEAFIYED
jgi:hypothetical protein